MIAFLGIATAPVLALFVLMRCMVGVADSFAQVGAARSFDDGRTGRGSAYTRFAALFVAGTAVGPVVAVVISHAWGTSAVFFVAACVAAAGTFVAGDVGAVRHEASPAGRVAPEPIHWRALFYRPVVVAGTGLGLANLGFGAVYGFGVLLGRSIGMRSPELLLSAFSITLIGGRVLGASLPDRVGLGRTVVAATVLSAVALFLAGSTSSVAVLVAAFLALGLGYAFIMPAMLAEAAGVAGDERSGAAVGTMMGLLDLVLTAGTVLLGVSASGFGNASTFVIAGAAAVLSLPVLRWWRHSEAAGRPTL